MGVNFKLGLIRGRKRNWNYELGVGVTPTGEGWKQEEMERKIKSTELTSIILTVAGRIWISQTLGKLQETKYEFSTKSSGELLRSIEAGLKSKEVRLATSDDGGSIQSSGSW